MVILNKIIPLFVRLKLDVIFLFQDYRVSELCPLSRILKEHDVSGDNL
jgi:hypothetical protein